MKNVVIVGFPGAGKTTIGKKLAVRLGLSFVDLDAAIEEKYHTTIPHLFEKYGEFVFRKCEQQMLTELLQQQDLLIATGGGAPCFEDAMDRINANAVSVYLQLSEKSLVLRLMNSKKRRPLVQAHDEMYVAKYVQEQLAGRSPFYQKATITLKGEDFDFDQAAALISEAVSASQCHGQ